MCKYQIVLKPSIPTEELFAAMEAEGLIIMLNGDFNVRRGYKSEGVKNTNKVHTIYQTKGFFGGHKLIHVELYEDRMTKLTSHPEPEDFILAGNSQAEPFVIIISRLQHEMLIAKLEEETLIESDFYCFYAPVNQPNLMCFTMMPEYPHAELLIAPLKDGELAPTFFVTESRDLPENIIDTEHIVVCE